MLIPDNSDPIDIRAGVYRHYKGPLYQVVGYSHNASEGNRIEVLYIGLELDPSKPGPRWATREWREFFQTVCPFHGGINAYHPEHERMIGCNPESWVDRFTYMGAVYYKGF